MLCLCAQLKKKFPKGLPPKKGLLGGDRKYFDSADWAKDKAAAQPEEHKEATSAHASPAKPDDEMLQPPPALSK